MIKRLLFAAIGILIPTLAFAQVEGGFGNDPFAANMAAQAAPAASGPVDPNTLTIFARMTTAILDPLHGAITGIETSLIAYLLTIGPPLLSSALAITAATIMLAPSGEFPLLVIVRQIIRFGVAMTALASAAAFQQWVAQPIMQLPTELSNAISGAAGGTPVAGEAFDKLWNHALAVAETVQLSIPNGWSWTGLAQTIEVAIFEFIAIGAILIAWLEWLGSTILLLLLVSIGPIAVLAWTFKFSRAWFNGWLSAVTGVVTATVMLIALLAVAISVEQITIDKMLNAPSGGNIAAQIGELLGVAAIFVAVALLAIKIPRIATGIGGGTYASIGSGAAAASVGASAYRSGSKWMQGK